MVHALLESWRVLEADGVLIDLRPFYSHPALEVITSEEIFIPGNIDDEGDAADDIAADEAVAETVRRGFFSLEVRDSFLFSFYWNSLEGVLAYAAEKWQFAEISPAVVERARQYVAGMDGPYRIRVRNQMHLRTYRRLPVAHPHLQR